MNTSFLLFVNTSLLFGRFNLICCAFTVVVGIGLSIWMWKRSDETNSYQLRSYIPTVWTSLGILFTFVSLLVGLMNIDFKEGLSIIKLVENICPAFTTSVLGIAGAIVTSLLIKFSLAEEESELDNKSKGKLKYSSKREQYTPELILFEIIEEIRESRGESSEDNETLNSTIESLKNTVNGSIEKLQSSLLNEGMESFKYEHNGTREAITNALGEQRKDFESVVNELKKSFETTIREQNEKLDSKLDKLDNSIGNKIEQYNKTSEGIITTLVNSVINKLESESRMRNEELQKFIDDTTLKITNLINEQVEQYKGISGNMNAVVSDIRKLFEEDVKQAIERFADEQHQVSMETLSQWNSKLVADANESINRHSAKMRRTLSKLSKRANASYNSFDESIDGLVQNIDITLQNLYRQQEKRMKEIGEENGKYIESSLKTNRESIDTILNANKDAIERVSNEIKADNSSIKNELAVAQQRWKKEAEKIENDYSERVVGIHSKAESEISEIQKRIIVIERTLQERLESIKDAIVNSTTKFENKLSEVKDDALNQDVKTLEELNVRIRQAFPIEALQSAGIKLANGIDETLNRFNTNTKNINDKLTNITNSITVSADKYAKTISDYDDKLGYMESTLNTLKQHITSIAVLQGVLGEINEAVQRVEKMRDVVKQEASKDSESNKTSRGKKQES